MSVKMAFNLNLFKIHRPVFSQLFNYATAPSATTPANCEQGRHKFHKDTEKALNEQVGAELNAAFAYLSMAFYFGQTQIALPGCQGYFMNMHQEEHEHAMIFSNYILMRGGNVLLQPVSVPKDQDFKCVKNAFEAALGMEKSVKEKLEQLFDVAEKNKDLQVMDLVSTDFMEEQNKSICEIARLLSRAKMVDNPVGEYLFDQLLFKSFVLTNSSNLMYKRNFDDAKLRPYK